MDFESTIKILAKHLELKGSILEMKYGDQPYERTSAAYIASYCLTDHKAKIRLKVPEPYSVEALVDMWLQSLTTKEPIQFKNKHSGKVKDVYKMSLTSDGRVYLYMGDYPIDSRDLPKEWANPDGSYPGDNSKVYELP